MACSIQRLGDRKRVQTHQALEILRHHGPASGFGNTYRMTSQSLEKKSLGGGLGVLSESQRSFDLDFVTDETVLKDSSWFEKDVMKSEDSSCRRETILYALETKGRSVMHVVTGGDREQAAGGCCSVHLQQTRSQVDF